MTIARLGALSAFSLLVACGAAAPATTSVSAPAPECPERGLAVRVLGSGGPIIIDDDRASSGYLVLLDGDPQLLIDAGGGVALRMAQARVAPQDLRGVLISHTHVDHTADLIALLKSASFSDRRAPLPVIGPSGQGVFPGLEAFLGAQLGEGGAWPYLGGYLEADGEPFPLLLDEVDVSGPARSRSLGPLRVRSVGVPHGPVPALGFVVDDGDASVAFAGDQRLDDPRFAELARGADLLVAHHAIPEGAEGVAANLHATPSQIGAFARDAGVERLVLSHHMARSLAELETGLAEIRDRFHGELRVAADLDCFPVGPH